MLPKMSAPQTMPPFSTPAPVSVVVESSTGQKTAKPLAITAPMRPVAAVVVEPMVVAVAAAVPEAIPVAVMLSEPKPAAVMALTAPVRLRNAVVAEPVVVAVVSSVPEAKPTAVMALTAKVRSVAAEPVLAAVVDSVSEAIPAAVSPAGGSRHRIFAPLPDRLDASPPAKPSSHAWRNLA